MKKVLLPLATLSYDAVQLRPGAECVNIPSYVVTFPATKARKNFFGSPTGPTLLVQICELAIYIAIEQKNNKKQTNNNNNKKKIKKQKQYHTFSSENYHVLQS